MAQGSLSTIALARRLALVMLPSLLISAQGIAAPQVRVGDAVQLGTTATPPTDEQCRASARHRPCYSPQEIRTAYGLNPLIDAGMVGAGQTIVLIESFGSPTIANDLAVFDQGYGLPDPPSLKVIAPLGTVPFDPTNNDQVSWAFETTLDVEWAHAIAPGANIVVLTSPIAETEGTQGLPEFLELERYALDHHLGKIISQSFGATENTLFDAPGRKVLADFSALYTRAVAEHVTVLASAGDTGSSNLEADLKTFFPFPTVIFPASSPLVTAIGGTSLFASTTGEYMSETVWNRGDAGGGGISQVFHEPLYQLLTLPRAVSGQLAGKRGIPDVSYNADGATTILVYLSFLGPNNAGYFGIGGTSEGAPQWAGIIADLNQYAGRPLGFINPALYLIGGAGGFSHIGRDITVGNNALNGVPGYSATTGWDLASGWGTPNLIGILGRPFELLDK